MAVEMGCKNLGFRFFQKIWNLKSPNFRFFKVFSRKKLTNPDFRLTVTAENCCFSD